MNNIYVSELPKNCLDCPCLSSEYWACKILDKEVKGIGQQRLKECPIKTLSVALAEERKKVVTKIKAQLQFYAMTFNDYDKMLEILDQVEEVNYARTNK